MEYVVNILVGLGSGIIGVLASFWWQKKMEIKKQKTDLIINILGYRYQLTGNYSGTKDEIVRYLNQISTVFYNSNEIVDAVIQYRKSKTSDDNVTLIKLMYDDVKIEYKYNDNLIDTPFSYK